MRKILSFLALMAFSVMSWAAVNITVTPSNVDFGTVSIKGKTYVEDSITINVSYSGLQQYCGVVFEDDQMPEEHAAFWISGTNVDEWIYGGDAYTPAEGQGLQLHYYAEQAGTYTGRIRFYSYTDADWEIKSPYVYLNITLVVSGDAQVATTTPYERIQTTSGLSVGDTVIFVNEAAGAVSGALNTSYLTAITEGVTINTSTGQADIPEEAQTFVVSQYGGNWQFTATGTSNKLALDITGKGAFTYAAPVANQILVGWGISISNGVAEIGKPDGTFPVRFNSDRFKPYKSAAGTDIALYKKAGVAQQIQSSLTIEDVIFGDVENDEQKSVTVQYTAENLTDDIIWEIEGTDAALFDVASQGTRTAGTVTVTYLGTSSKTGVLNARLAYLTQDAVLDPMEGSKAISINLTPATVKLTNLAFADAPTTIDQGASIDMSQYIVYTPNNATDKSLTWTTDHDYQGTIDANGVLTAKHVTGTITVTATSVRVPSVSASHTLTITVPTITDFTLSHSEMTMNIGGAQTLSVTAFVPEYASATPSFSSDNTAVATVSNKGLVTAKGIGEAVISATIGSVTKTCTIHVVPVDVISVEFNPSTVSLTVGSEMQLNPNVVPLQAKNEYTMTYESDAPAIATVSETGLVSGIAEGQAVITATLGGVSGQITIHVVAARMFTKVTDALTLAAKDTIILALANAPVIAGARDGKKLTVLTSGITVSETEAYADEACRMVLGKENNQDGFTLTIVGASKPIAVASSGNDIVDANTQNCKFWEIVADESNGYFVRNLGNTNAMFKYHAGNAAIKPYKATTVGAVYVYAYMRKYVDPSTTVDIQTVESDGTNAQKILRNGQVLILRGDKMYDTTGRCIK
ncbi:MAG: Ig-like domain-containing protein [Paludibacteraceae bacterium]|nr:Ig-like domain-containing protein [Paludibacteraceae bacterium]